MERTQSVTFEPDSILVASLRPTIGFCGGEAGRRRGGARGEGEGEGEVERGGRWRGRGEGVRGRKRKGVRESEREEGGGAPSISHLPAVGSKLCRG